MRQTHFAGEKLFVDHCGPTVPIIDPETHERRHAQIFVAVMGAKSYSYVEILMNHIIQTYEAAGFWSLTSTIFPENSSSIALHKKSGFREIGYREKLSKIKGIWRDVLLF